MVIIWTKQKGKISWEEIVNKFAVQDTPVEEKKTLGKFIPYVQDYGGLRQSRIQSEINLQ
jgi:hypothetical protein